jgi:MSHA biogenesis protein MshM
VIKQTFGLTQEPFSRSGHGLFPQQHKIFDIIKTHSQHGGLSVITGQSGVGKSVIKEALENLGKEGNKETMVVTCSRTMHTYFNILKQLAHSMEIEFAREKIEKELIAVAYRHVRENKTLYILIDEAHLLDMEVLRKLRLLFDQFPKKHNLVLFGQPELLYFLSMKINEDIKSRITYSEQLLGLNDEGLEHYIEGELTSAKLGANTFDEGAHSLILRNAQGNLRLCRNLCYGSLIEACRDGKRIVTIKHVNGVLIQPHWRSHDELLKQQAGVDQRAPITTDSF